MSLITVTKENEHAIDVGSKDCRFKKKYVGSTITTDYATISTNPGVILRKNDKAVKLTKGSYIDRLSYVEPNTFTLKSVSGVLRDVIYGELTGCTCSNPSHITLVPLIIVIDKSTDYNGELVRVNVDDIRDFIGDEINPDNAMVADVNFVGNTTIAFRCGFEPTYVLWNNKSVSPTKTGVSSNGDIGYTMNVDTVYAYNTLSVIGTGSTVVSTVVTGLMPTIDKSLTVDTLNTMMSALTDKYYSTAENEAIEVPDNELYVVLFNSVYGDIDSLKGQITKISLGKNSFSTKPTYKLDENKLYIQAGSLLNMLDSGKTVINWMGFSLDVSSIAAESTSRILTIGDLAVYGGTEEDSVTIDNNIITLNHYELSSGVSFNLYDDTGVKIPADTKMLVYEDVSEGQRIGVTVSTENFTDAFYNGYSTKPITVVKSTVRKVRYVVRELGKIDLTFIVNDLIKE